jgi:hypothetical protein
MKVIETVDLREAIKTDAFSETIEHVKSEASEMVRKTFSIEQSQLDIINGIAFELSKKAGKPVGASEALRNLLNNFESEGLSK